MEPTRAPNTSTPPPTPSSGSSSSSDSNTAARPASLPDFDGVASEAVARQDAHVPAGKADVGKRFLALLIDSAIAFVLGFVPVIGGLIGAAYFVVRDGLELDVMHYRSLGKHVMKLRPVRLDGQPMDLETSARRNWMFSLGAVTTVLAWIPFVGWLLMIPVVLVALALGLYEGYKVITDDEGRRWGDALAQTKVVEDFGA